MASPNLYQKRTVCPIARFHTFIFEHAHILLDTTRYAQLDKDPWQSTLNTGSFFGLTKVVLHGLEMLHWHCCDHINKYLGLLLMDLQCAGDISSYILVPAAMYTSKRKFISGSNKSPCLGAIGVPHFHWPCYCFSYNEPVLGKSTIVCHVPIHALWTQDRCEWTDMSGDIYFIKCYKLNKGQFNINTIK